MVAFPEYTYIAVLGVLCGFIFAFGIGANDVANAFGSSVSARSLTLKQAIVLGSIMEFTGAILLGAKVTGTIRGKIIETEYYEDEPEIFMFGSLCALMVGMIWLLVATALEFPVSTTHDIVGAYLGFTIAAHGVQSVDWHMTGKIFISWGAAPIFSGILSGIFFKTLFEVVLKDSISNTFDRALHVFPIVVFVAIGCNLFFILFKSDNNIEMAEEDWGHQVVLPATLGGATVAAVFTYFFVVPRLHTQVIKDHAEAERLAREEHDGEQEADGRLAAHQEKDGRSEQLEDMVTHKEELSDSNDPKSGEEKTATNENQVESKNILVRTWDVFAENTFRQDLHRVSLEESKRAALIWARQAEYDAKTERLFQYLQVFTACMASFAHGANDVANAIAPVSGILHIYKDGDFATKADVNKGILAMGGAAIGLGFTFFGYRIVKAVAFKLTSMSPSRGFCIELGAALAVSLSSFMQIPVSTTQCLVGATCGVGLAAGGIHNVEWWFLLRTLTGWIFIFFIVALVNAGFFSFVVFAPKME